MQILSVLRVTLCLQLTTYRRGSSALARSSMSSPCSTSTGEFHFSVHPLRTQRPLRFLHPQVNFNSLFFQLMSSPCSSCVHRVSCSLLQRKPKEDPDLTEKVAPLHSLLFWRYPILFQFWPISDIFQLCHSHFSQMENVLLSTGLPFASDFASHLNKITQDDHCKYGNTSIAMEI